MRTHSRCPCNWYDFPRSFRTTRHESERGIALLTVLALLTVFGLILVGFTYSLRLEEQTVSNYIQAAKVTEAAEAGIQSGLSMIDSELAAPNGKYLLGKKQPWYVSRNDAALKVGPSGSFLNDTTFDARRARYNPWAIALRRGRSLPVAVPLGIDEDPKGDTTGSFGPRGRMTADGQPGFAGVDDNLDGIVDNGASAADDDEDGRADEDPLDVRRDGRFFPQGTGFDEDGDAQGVFDESAKLNLNFAGNTSGQSQGYAYGQGATPFELDLAAFLYGRMNQRAEDIAKKIVNYRQGDVADGGKSYTPPGAQGDDDGDNSEDIKTVRSLGDVFAKVNEPNDYQLQLVTGNGKDDDGDGLIDEEDERYIGASYEANGSPTHRIPSADQISQNDILNFRLGDRIDNDGDGVIDEPDEGIDEPDEFDPNQPHGDDHPFATLDELTMLAQVGPGTLKKIDHFATVYSEADQTSPSLSANGADFLRLNPNLLSSWNPEDTEEDVSQFQYGPKMNVEDFFALQVDNDGDWQALGEGPGNGIDERGDGMSDSQIGDGINGKDDDGDGLIDEPSDDWDGNGYPSADFDRYGEPDVGAPYYLSDNYDNDHDGKTDEGRTQTDIERYGLRKVGGDSQRPRLESTQTDLLAGMVQEGNGADDDGDSLVDDTGDFNGDWMITYDPEWHLNEDPPGDADGDGYPGIGAPTTSKDQNTDAGDLVAERPGTKLRAKNANDLRTSFADDDADGFADFHDPQVIAAMIRPDADLVDNDNDGEVDEPGERYVAAWDDDEDGRMDEDPPEFQFILNLADYIDQPVPAPVSGDPDVQKVLGLSPKDLVLADPPTVEVFDKGITSSRQRAFEMHPKFLSGPNQRQKALLENEMDLLLPNPPKVHNKVTYRGIEGIRINEALVKPMIRLEAEETLTSLTPNANGGFDWTSNGQFSVLNGQDDDGVYGVSTGTVYEDTNWSSSILVRPEGFRNTIHPIFPTPGLYDSLAPSVVFAVTNTAPASQSQGSTGGTGGGSTGIGADSEIAQWVFTNIPPGIYDVVLYLDPADVLRGEVKYYVNGRQVQMRSDFYYQSPNQTNPDGPADLMPILPLNYGGAKGFALEGYSYYTPKMPPEYIRYLNQYVIGTVPPGALTQPGHWASLLQSTPQIMLAQAYNNQFLVDPMGQFVSVPSGQAPQPGLRATSMLRLPYRLYPVNPNDRVEVGSDGILEVKIEALPPKTGFYVTTFDRVELINLSAQYLELVNLTPDDIDLTGWTVNTPYGKYILQPVNGVRPIIPRIKPLFEKDDGRENALDNGIPLPGRPWDRAVYPRERGGLVGQNRTADDLRLDNNFLLLVHDEKGFKQWVGENYPALSKDVPILALPRADNPLQDPAYNPFGESPTFKLVDRESDILTDNYDPKVITLTDPAGNEVDRFEYKTTFNNLVVDVPGNYFKLPTPPNAPDQYEIRSLDVVALPGYRGMETYERGDPTQVVTEDRPNRNEMTKRFTPTMRLLARDAAIETFAVQPGQEENNPLTVTLFGGRQLSANPALTIPENPQTTLDDRRYVGGWDFVGDAPDPGAIGTDPDGERWGGPVRSPEFGTSYDFKMMAGGFEDYTNAFDPMAFLPSRQPFPGDLVRFTWTFGLRELIRAGFDPDVDDQITVRVRGRGQHGVSGVAAIVGEVLNRPMMTVIDPGKEREGGMYKRPQVAPNPLNPLGFDVFTKLRDGDTAFTIDLRRQFKDLYTDLESGNGEEPLIVLRMIMRKTTPDIPSMMDNYYFYAIELCGRGRKEGGSSDSYNENARMALIAGTPGRENPGWVPAYPRRRRKIDAPTQRDQYDIVDNTPFVKNGLLANPGEISQIMTGGRFETVNGPIIAQRLEEKTIDQRRFDSNAELARRMVPSDEGDVDRLLLAQRERLDQFENQYTPLYGMITTSDSAFSPGLVNINTAIREVLTALPADPPQRDDPTQIPDLKHRFEFNSIVADFIIAGRNPLGRDQQFGVAEVNDDLSRRGTVDDSAEFKLPSVGRDEKSLKEFSTTSRGSVEPAIKNVLKDGVIGVQDVQGQSPGSVDDMYASTIVSLPDDGPYEDIGRLLGDIVHLPRRERMAAAVRRDLDRTGDGVPDGAGDLRERLNKRLNLTGKDALTPRDMEEIMQRLSGLITVRSRVFSILTGGKSISEDGGGVAAARRYKSVYRR